jgi:hypothetical protein
MMPPRISQCFVPQISTMTAWGHNRSFGDVGSMSGLPESRRGYAVSAFIMALWLLV